MFLRLKTSVGINEFAYKSFLDTSRCSYDLSILEIQHWLTQSPELDKTFSIYACCEYCSSKTLSVQYNEVDKFLSIKTHRIFKLL